MENLRESAKRGRTVVTTIHQPASEIFSLIDRILLLSKGTVVPFLIAALTPSPGRVVFFGRRDEAIAYFASAGFQCPPFTNPFDFFIDVSSINYRTLDTELQSRQQACRCLCAWRTDLCILR
jgi:hypothetical protein